MAVYRDESIVGDSLTEQEQEMVSLYDQGWTDQQLAEKFGYTNPGSAGNVRRRALTKAGRGSEVRGGGGRRQATAPRIKGLAGLLIEGYQTAKRTVESLTERLTEARSDAEATPEQIEAREVARLTQRVAEAQDNLDKFEAQDPKVRAEWAEQQLKAAATKREQTEKELGDSLKEAEAAMQEIMVEADAKGINLEPEDAEPETEATDADSEADEATEDSA